MRTVVIIPARLQSSRLPNKLLAQVNGKTVLENCFNWASKAGYSTFVASGDTELLNVIPEGFSIPTTEKHCNGTERCAEAARFLNLSAEDVIINVQGDIALYDPEVLQFLSGIVRGDRCDMATTCCFFDSREDFKSVNKVKAITNHSGDALYFTRQPIVSYPYARLHVGIYAMKAFMLGWYKGVGSCLLEDEEHLEQMRWLYHGRPVRIYSMGNGAPITIDSADDLQTAEDKWKKKAPKWIK